MKFSSDKLGEVIESIQVFRICFKEECGFGEDKSKITTIHLTTKYKIRN